MATPQVLIGNTVRFGHKPGREFSYLDASGDRVAAAPTTLEGWYRGPSDVADQSTTVYNGTATGAYYIEVELDEVGTWIFRLNGIDIGPNNIDSAIEGTVECTGSTFTNL